MRERRLQAIAASCSVPGAGSGELAMPRSSAHRSRRAVALSLACGALLLAACSSGGGSGDSAVIPDSSAPAQTTGTSSVTLAWGAAEGPVAGYSVYVQRDGVGGFDHEQDVAQPQVDLT